MSKCTWVDGVFFLPAFNLLFSNNWPTLLCDGVCQRGWALLPPFESACLYWGSDKILRRWDYFRSRLSSWKQHCLPRSQGFDKFKLDLRWFFIDGLNEWEWVNEWIMELLIDWLKKCILIDWLKKMQVYWINIQRHDEWKDTMYEGAILYISHLWRGKSFVMWLNDWSRKIDHIDWLTVEWFELFEWTKVTSFSILAFYP